MNWLGQRVKEENKTWEFTSIDPQKGLIFQALPNMYNSVCPDIILYFYLLPHTETLNQ